ncbi:NifB/NifX family molybdenum-iron cluster-binding protein [Thiomicrorhabdus xiamenensis]|uniref:Nitrogen fixation protein n=1 Tax=Thiomicrorhabdus xiamenensis TaxID=2739063 RepID=A0A7D4NSS0_9GAMM|nr:NifB/NifX family molybdenum-iron cluster-binding protein [Thiomicrorhabdus xiamenensis]QKI90177.1 nitrogen fixation protein [Thiomicrorhabdus xiamenensis]
MKVAFTSPNGKTISGHAGKCPGYLVYDIAGDEVVSKERIKLSKEQVFRNYSGSLADHPLNGVQLFITQSLGDGLQRKLAQEGIRVLVTEESNPDEIVQRIIKVKQASEA